VTQQPEQHHGQSEGDSGRELISAIKVPGTPRRPHNLELKPAHGIEYRLLRSAMGGLSAQGRKVVAKRAESLQPCRNSQPGPGLHHDSNDARQAGRDASPSYQRAISENFSTGSSKRWAAGTHAPIEKSAIVSPPPVSQWRPLRESFKTAAKRAKFSSPRVINAGSADPRPSTPLEIFSNPTMPH